jgi:hypothetical protein
MGDQSLQSLIIRVSFSAEGLRVFGEGIGIHVFLCFVYFSAAFLPPICEEKQREIAVASKKRKKVFPACPPPHPNPAPCSHTYGKGKERERKGSRKGARSRKEEKREP